MLAAVITEGRLRVAERPDPAPGPGEVRIRVAAAGLNAADLLQVAGHYPAPAGWPPDIPGLELAGTVDATGPGAESWLGRRVCAIVGGGGHATAARVSAAHLLAVPEDVDLRAAGAFAEGFVTAHDALVSQAGLRPGERLVVTGAAGGVGTAAVQIGAMLGAHTIAVTRSRAHHDALRDLGALEAILTEELADIAPVDVVLELVGAATAATSLGRLGPHGRLVVIGVGGGSRLEVDLLAVMQRRLRLTGSTLRSRSPDEKAQAVAAAATDLGDRWSRGGLRVPVADGYPLAEVARAYAAFGQSGRFGHIVLEMP